MLILTKYIHILLMLDTSMIQVYLEFLKWLKLSQTQTRSLLSMFSIDVFLKAVHKSIASTNNNMFSCYKSYEIVVNIFCGVEIYHSYIADIVCSKSHFFLWLVINCQYYKGYKISHPLLIKEITVRWGIYKLVQVLEMLPL